MFVRTSLLNELSQKVPVGPVLSGFEFDTKPDQPGPSSSIRLEVMCVQTCHVSANNFARGVISSISNFPRNNTRSGILYSDISKIFLTILHYSYAQYNKECQMCAKSGFPSGFPITIGLMRLHNFLIMQEHFFPYVKCQTTLFS